MLLFLDTEFTDLVNQPQLLSVAMVAQQPGLRPFYAEVTDMERLLATSWYGLSAVLPQFGRVAGAACSYAELGQRLCAFLDDLRSKLPEQEALEVAHGYHLDWELVELAGKDAGGQRWQAMRRHIRPVNVFEFTGFGAGKSAAKAYFKAQSVAHLTRHHALCDAHALRRAYAAAVDASAAKGRAPKGKHVHAQEATAV